jgi:MFS family permease
MVDKLGPRPIIGPSAFALVLAMMLTSLCTKFWHFILCQGVFGGIATGFLYSPAAAVVGQYFHKKRPLAMGIITSGSALGGILYPIILDQMLNHRGISFGWTQRTIGFLGLFMGTLATVCIKPRMPPRAGTYLLPRAFLSPAYALQVFGLFFIVFGVFTVSAVLRLVHHKVMLTYTAILLPAIVCAVQGHVDIVEFLPRHLA